MEAKSYSEDTILKSELEAKYSQAEIDTAYLEAKKAGMKEVAEAVNQKLFSGNTKDERIIWWQAFLKEKGL